jgi:hypothetical protein
MKLSFTTIIDKKPTYFLEKIWKGLLQDREDLGDIYMEYQRRHLDKFGCFWDGDDFREFLNQKIHTIRRDTERKWKPGMEIQLIINQNEQDEFQFAPLLKCQSTQEIHLDYSNTVIDGPAVFINYELLSSSVTNELAINDGFSNKEDLFFYFKEDFHGTLIHWTDQQY